MNHESWIMAPSPHINHHEQKQKKEKKKKNTCCICLLAEWHVLKYQYAIQRKKSMKTMATMTMFALYVCLFFLLDLLPHGTKLLSLFFSCRCPVQSVCRRRSGLCSLVRPMSIWPQLALKPGCLAQTRERESKRKRQEWNKRRETSLFQRSEDDYDLCNMLTWPDSIRLYRDQIWPHSRRISIWEYA